MLAFQLVLARGLSPQCPAQPLGTLAQTYLPMLPDASLLAGGTLGFGFFPVGRLVCGHQVCPWLCPMGELGAVICALTLPPFLSSNTLPCSLSTLRGLASLGVGRQRSEQVSGDPHPLLWVNVGT